MLRLCIMIAFGFYCVIVLMVFCCFAVGFQFASLLGLMWFD